MVRGRQAERTQMVTNALATRDIADHRVLAAIDDVPREAFVAPGLAEYA